MKISIVGTGYVGLVTAACLAEVGHTVTCVDVDATKVDKVNAGVSPIHEASLDDLLDEHVGTRLSATTNLRLAVAETELTLIAVGTPTSDGQIDLRQVIAAAGEVGEALAEKTGYHVVVVKSTVIPGTTEGPVRRELESRSGKKVGGDIGLGMNPEFLRQGRAVFDSLNPDRIVLGGSDDRSIEAMAAVYAPYEDVEVLSTTPRTAEMIKYAANSLFATLISFSNELANFCATEGDIDAADVMRGLHLDRRLSPLLETGERIHPELLSYLMPGCGFGGSCFPKDVAALVSRGSAIGSEMQLLQSVLDVNEAQPMKLIEMLLAELESLDGVPVAVLGLSFKPGTDDMRQSPAIPVVESLVAAGAIVTVYDPVARPVAERVFSTLPLRFAEGITDALADTEAVLVLTAWPEFLELPQLVNSSSPPVIVDGRRTLAASDFARYRAIGL
ncbi:MAG: UDP-glucose/GDP-mannose dehydrogenase family protein [Acidimicrobiia bacterium]|nr:UDP-glucose/GDP-mannose dehydrogenase family protein [Acidimicrobiia bacterium]